MRIRVTNKNNKNNKNNNVMHRQYATMCNARDIVNPKMTCNQNRNEKNWSKLVTTRKVQRIVL